MIEIKIVVMESLSQFDVIIHKFCTSMLHTLYCTVFKEIYPINALLSTQWRHFFGSQTKMNNQDIMVFEKAFKNLYVCICIIHFHNQINRLGDVGN